MKLDLKKFLKIIKNIKIKNIGKNINFDIFLSKIIKNNKKLNKEKRIKRYPKFQLKLKFNKFNLKKWIINITIYLILILLIILKTDFIKIKNINVISLDSNTNSTLIEKNLKYIKGKLIFNIGKQIIKNKIFEIEQNINQINISKIYPKTIKIEISSFNTIFKTKIKNETYLITSNGVFIPKKNLKYDLENLEIKHANLPNFPLYKKILNIKDLNKIKLIENKLIENIVGLQIKNIIYYKIEKEVHFIVNNNTRLIFDLVDNLKGKLNQIYVFNKEKRNILKPGIEYIDNRILGKIYYCPSNEKKQCNLNLKYIYNLKNN